MVYLMIYILCFLFFCIILNILFLLFIEGASINNIFYEIVTEKIGLLLFAIQFPAHHNLETKYSWLIYYLGKKDEDEFVSVAIKLGYPILS